MSMEGIMIHKDREIAHQVAQRMGIKTGIDMAVYTEQAHWYAQCDAAIMLHWETEWMFDNTTFVHTSNPLFCDMKDRQNELYEEIHQANDEVMKDQGHTCMGPTTELSEWEPPCAVCMEMSNLNYDAAMMDPESER